MCMHSAVSDWLGFPTAGHELCVSRAVAAYMYNVQGWKVVMLAVSHHRHCLLREATALLDFLARVRKPLASQIGQKLISVLNICI